MNRFMRGDDSDEYEYEEVRSYGNDEYLGHHPRGSANNNDRSSSSTRASSSNKKRVRGQSTHEDNPWNRTPRLVTTGSGTKSSNASVYFTDHDPYPCPKVVRPIRVFGEDEEGAREEGGGGKKKSTRGALMLGGTMFKRWPEAPEQPHRAEKEDENDIWMLKEMHYQMTYADTYLELSGDKVFAVEYFDRGVSLTCVAIYLICCGFLFQHVEERRHKMSVNVHDGYSWPANVLWWNSLQFINYCLAAHSLGILQFILVPVMRRLYYVLVSMSLTAMLCAYLQAQSCQGFCPWVLWIGFFVTVVTAGRPAITNRLGDSLADVWFFVIFLLFTVQAICAKDTDMLECTMMLLLAFAYAGPVGYWAGFFNFRIVIWTVCIYHALPALDDALGKRAGSHSPKAFVDVVWQDWHRIVQPIMQLPVTWGCNLKWCEPGLYALFEGGLGRQFSDRYTGPKGKGAELWAMLEGFLDDIELPPAFDDFLFWLFVICMILFNLYVLWTMEDGRDEVEVTRAKDPCIPFERTAPKDFRLVCG